MSVITTAIIEGALKWAVGRSIEFSAKQVGARLKKRDAAKELSDIVNRAIESAVAIVPSLTHDLRSEDFLNNVIAPLVVKFLANPTAGLSEEDLANKYIEIYVGPFLRGKSTDETLLKVFLTDCKTLQDAFLNFLQNLRDSLYATEHWREPIRDQALEEVRSISLRLEKKYLADVSSHDKSIDIDVARADAAEGSEALKSWTKTIGGQYIERPELYQLQQRIRENPFASTLVIGEAGSGKSALFAELTARLQEQGMVVFAIKADLLPPEVRTLEDVSKALGLQGHLLRDIEALSQAAPVAVLIDQLDAVSEVMDRSSHRMRLLLQVANHFREKQRKNENTPPVHVLVSSRQFEADYDARFRSLDAQIIHLSLPSIEQVKELLLKLSIAVEEVPVTLYEILRRPFALRLFVDILRRGGSAKGLIASDLLNTWLATANLGDTTQRRHTLEFLERLAGEMTETESLWRPADRYEIEMPSAVSAAIACGIIFRQRGLIGFSHQAWLDDFQAKNFSSGEGLAAYAWERQDGLFARPTILRGLQRLRAVDVNAYAVAINSLLGAVKTRRHLRHLLMDLISGQHAPIACEIGWVKKIIRNDVALAHRSLARVTIYWPHWRTHLRSLLAEVMQNPELTRNAIQILVVESNIDSEFVLNLISKYWGSEEYDFQVLQVFSKAGLWGPVVVGRLQVTFKRQEYDSYLIAEYMKKLADDRSAKLLSLYLDGLDVKKEERLSFHELSQLTEHSRLAFADVLLSWFVRAANLEAEYGSLKDSYSRSSSLPFSWIDGRFEDGIFAATHSTIIACATEQPTEFLKLCTPFFSIEVNEIQALIAEGLAAAGAALTSESIEFLLSDTRRLQLGTDTVDDMDNVLHVVQGWSTQLLLKAIVPFANPTQLDQLKEYIEGWNPYKDEAWATDDVTLRLRRRAWAEQMRFPLLELLPSGVLNSRRLRQVREWRAKQPVLKRRRGGAMASFVRSPMSAAQMANASDDDVFNMLDIISDNTEHWPKSRRRMFGGGSIEISRAFGEFGKAHPDRALRIAEERFRPAHHEHAAGELLSALSETGNNSQEILRLIHKWSYQGFSSDAWKERVASTLLTLAERSSGLGGQELYLLESWIVNDSISTANRIEQRVELEERNRQMNKVPQHRVEAVVFGRGLGGMTILPQDNFKLLSAMAAGFCCRAEPDWNAWLSALERHANRSEDPAIWKALLMFRGSALYNADRQRVNHLLERIWKTFPDAFSKYDIAHFLWDCRAMFPEGMLEAIRNSWLSSDNPKNRQAAGELLMATILVDGETDESNNQLEALVAVEHSSDRLGILFAAATAWRDADHELRQKAHPILMRFISHASANEAIAIASALGHRNAPNSDELTHQFLEEALNNIEILMSCLRRNFASTLQELLLMPGFEELVMQISSRCAELMLNKKNHGQGALGEKFVAIAVALQRSSEPIRTQAMDLYERLLDASAYGAEEAAEASLHRTLQH